MIIYTPRQNVILVPKIQKWLESHNLFSQKSCIKKIQKCMNSVAVWIFLFLIQIFDLFQMSWSTKRRNSRPSLTNSTRPSPRCPATKKIFYHPTNFPNFFPSQISFFRDFLPPSKSRNFAALLFCTFSPPFPKPFKKNEIILFSHGSFWMRWYLPLREINFASIFNQFAASQFLKEFFVSEKTFHLFLISRLQFFLRESAKK